MRLALLGPVMWFGALAFGQEHRVTDRNGNLWVSHWGDHRVSDHWSFHTEGHVRLADMGAQWQQWLVRPAVNYHLNDQVMFTLGYTYYRNFPYGSYPVAFPNWEHHLFQQVQLSQPIGKLRLWHRFRMEERFIAQMKPSVDTPSEGELDRYVYQNRFRYRVWLAYPIGKRDRTEPGAFTANLYDELFLNFGDPQRLDLMNQNRLSALLGYQASASMQLMAGYLLQNLQRPGAANGADLMEVNSTLHFVVVWNLDLRKKEIQVKP